MFLFTKDKPLYILIIIITSFIILALTTLIVLINSKEKSISLKNQGTLDLTRKIRNLNLPNNRIESNLKIINSNTSSKQEKYDALKSIAGDLQVEYSVSNNNELYALINKDIVNYAKTHFPSLIDENALIYPCQDPKCADSPQPPEIENIINKINSSDFPEAEKKILIHELKNTGYRSKNELPGKITEYSWAEDTIRARTDLSKKRINIEIANDIHSLIERLSKELNK